MPSASRILKIVRNVFLILAVLVAAFFFIFVPWFFTSIITHGQFHYPDPNDGKTPISYNLNFRWIDFTSPDGIHLKGWYIPAEGTARGTIIYCPRAATAPASRCCPTPFLGTAWDTTVCCSICAIKARVAAPLPPWVTRSDWTC